MTSFGVALNGQVHTAPQMDPRAQTDSREEWHQAPARIKVVGVGGGGCNTVRRMLSTRYVRGVHYVMTNTDVKSLEQLGEGSEGVELVQLGPKITRGWGAGGDFKVGQQAADESSEELRHALKDAELVFITAGMGGGTGTGAAPYVAQLAQEMGADVVGVVTTPFSFEGRHRQGDALAGIRRLRPHVNSLVVIHNDRLLRYVNQDAEMVEAFRTADEVVSQGILSISELINVPGEINVDFADVKTIMGRPGGALMAIGEGRGKMGPAEAVQHAIANPLLNLSIDGAEAVLFSVRGGRGLTLAGVNAAGELIARSVHKRAPIFFGMALDHSLEDKVQLTLIATGLKEDTWLGAMTGGVSGVIPGTQEHAKRRLFDKLKGKFGQSKNK